MKLFNSVFLPAKPFVASLMMLVFVPCGMESNRVLAESNPVNLEAALRTEDRMDLVRAVETEGDLQRGAMLFFQPFLGCVKCHEPHRADAPAMAPELGRLGTQTTIDHLIDSLLDPSKVIRKGFEAEQLAFADGRTIIVLPINETAERLVVRDVSTDEVIEVAKSAIEERKRLTASIMPAGQVNQLANRQQFLDLIRYLYEIAQGGPTRALELRPIVIPRPAPIPEYERLVDHAAFISEWSDSELAPASYQRGAAIYAKLCVNCHGTHEEPGSLPTSLRFASGKFKNGADPFRIYQTLTHGFGLMMAQSWMVPQQKYDVIYYLREAYLRPANPSQYFAVNSTYLAALPAGNLRGPAPRNLDPWSAMDYGTFLIGTYEAPGGRSPTAPNLAHKGIAIRLDSGQGTASGSSGGVARGSRWMIFEHDTLRVAAEWTRGDDGTAFIDWQGINFNGAHQRHPRIAGTPHITNPPGPGWAEPVSGRFDDPRIVGRDGRRYGPLPAQWGKYRGLHKYADQVVLRYDIGESPVFEHPSLGEIDGIPMVTRQLRIGQRSQPLTMLVATSVGSQQAWRVIDTSGAPHVAFREPDADQSPALTAAAFAPRTLGLQWDVASDGCLRLTIPAGDEPIEFLIGVSDSGTPAVENRPSTRQLTQACDHLLDLRTDLNLLIQGGPRLWPEVLSTMMTPGHESGPFVVDTLQLPVNNPWNCQMRLTGFDFFPTGETAAVCTWDGDVWLLRGLPAAADESPSDRTIRWQRIAAGLFQPLGLKIIDGQIYVGCRDQIVILRDLNGDDETDYYECFNSDHQVTEHFHEFAMGLQVDSAGNLYYAKSARHALPAVVPHHGTLLRVSPDGKRTDILANGFRAANGVCLNPDGTFVVTDQEGHWNPKNRINWVRPVEAGERPRFYGNLFGYHDVTDPADSAMESPLCWITNAFDRSPSELLWVDSERWGPLKNSLLNFSYGYGKVYIVPFEKLADGQVQGGMSDLPIPNFPTGTMRGRFHPRDGQLYVCGMFAWAGDATQPGGMYRIRYTGQAIHVPIGLKVLGDQIEITFSGPLDRAAAEKTANYSIRTWDLHRSADYGSAHYNERQRELASAALDPTGRIVRLKLPDLSPTWCMSVSYQLETDTGTAVSGRIHNTIHSTDGTR